MLFCFSTFFIGWKFEKIITKKCRFHNHGIDLFPWLQNLKFVFLNSFNFFIYFYQVKGHRALVLLNVLVVKKVLSGGHAHTHRWETIFTLCLIYLFVQFFCRKDLRQRNLKLWDDVNMFVGTVLSWPQSV